MKVLSAISIAILAVSSLFATRGYYKTPSLISDNNVVTEQKEEISDFEKAVQIIKKYETLHQPKHYPFVGYGHLVQKGEKFSRTKALSESEADKLLRKDLLKNCAVFRSFGADSLILGVLAYNIGPGAALRSSVAQKLKAGNRDIYESYVAHSRYKGKVHSQIKRRRIEEFETLFIKNPESKKEEIIEKEVITTENSLLSMLRIPDSVIRPLLGFTARVAKVVTYNSPLVATLQAADHHQFRLTKYPVLVSRYTNPINRLLSCTSR